MVVSSIKVFARLKKEFKLKENSYEVLRSHPNYEDIFFYKDNNSEGSSAKFRFYQVFDQDSDQDSIFEAVAKPVGFNGTIFAYGQTGSGKTYTMTGSTKMYRERGIIPRSLQFVFSSIEKTDDKPTLYISYMEIYNEICYDLLNPRGIKTASRLEELPRVTVLEGKEGEARLRNLSVLPVSTEEEAMRLLFLGDTNRAIAETPLNEYSSRSHCIFTIYITSRPNDTQALRYSKLNLVDLAGSERVHKSHISGTVLNEAKHINLSLHYLQQVILALSESKRLHIPYRNSLMTFILKDSLAGNCLTVMLATLAASSQNMLESISTCKFAQRVSLIKTEPIINEISDPCKEIQLLRNEILELRKQLANRSIPVLELEKKSLTTKQKELCEKKLEEYLNSPEEHFKVEFDSKILQYCFSMLKNKIRKLEQQQIGMQEHNSTCSSENLSNYQHIMPTNDLDSNKYSPKSKHDKGLFQKFTSDPQNCEDINYYNRVLSCTYKKAKLLASTIEECQANIRYIREKLDSIADAGCSKQKISLGQELESQQTIYKHCLTQLNKLKQETLQMETGLKRAKIKMTQQFSDWVRGTNNHQIIGEKRENTQLYFKDDLTMYNKDDGSCCCCSGKTLEFDPGFKSHQYSSCQCSGESIDASDFLKYHKGFQDQNYMSHCFELPEYTLNHSCGDQGHCFNEASGLGEYGIFDKQITHKLQREKSVITFSAENIKSHTDVRRSGLRSRCHRIDLPQINNNLSKACYNIDNNCEQSSKDCDNRSSYRAEVRYEDSSEFLNPNYLMKTYPKPVHPSRNRCSCDCDKEYEFENNSEYTQYSKKPLKLSQHVLNERRDSVEDCTIPLKHDEYDSISHLSKHNDTINRQPTILVATPAYLDTQLIPNKLCEEDIKEDFTTNIKCKETKSIPVSLTDCPEKSSSNCKTSLKYDNATKKTYKLENKSKCHDTPNNYCILSCKETESVPISSPNCQERPSSSCGSPKASVKYDNATKKPYKLEGEGKREEKRNMENIYLASDTDEFRAFMDTISLTGDEEIDKEICNFYRSKMCF